jgi:methyl-accepting chemotaxis protein
MRFVRFLFLRLVGVLLVPSAIGWYVVSRLVASDEAYADALMVLVPASLLGAVSLAGFAALVFGAPIERALAAGTSSGPEEQRRLAERALRLPVRTASLVLGSSVAIAVGVASYALHERIAGDLMVAAVGITAAFGLMAAMLSYSVALGSAARALMVIGSVDVSANGTVRGKVLAVCCGLLGVATLLIVPVSYVRYRADLQRRYLDVTALAQERAVVWVGANRVRDAAELVYLASGASTVVLDRSQRAVARVPEEARQPATLELRPGTGNDRVPGGWLVRRAAGPYTIISFLSAEPLERQQGEFWKHGTVIGALLFAACALLVWFAAQGLSIPIGLLGSAARQIASGDLSVRPPSVSRDELGQLASDFRDMARGLAALVTDVQAAAASVQEGTRDIGTIGDHVKASAREEHERVVTAQAAVEAMQDSVRLVGRGIESLSDYVHSTSSAVGEMAAALEEVRRQASELENHMGTAESDVRRLSEAGHRAQTQLGALGSLASNAQGTLSSVSGSLAGLETSAIASQLAAAQAAELAEQAGIVVRDTVDGIESVRAAVGDAKKRVTVLGRRSDDIDKILDFIGEVAGRTNLLSLNASIIATQAGEHGKAFSVVAEQIRELAAQISSSTKSIGQIIRAVRDDVSGTARLIDRGDELAANGVAHARKSVGALQEIRTATARGHETAAAIRDAVQTHAVSTRDVSNLVASVAANSQSLSDALEMVGTSVTAVGSVSESIRALADRVTRALDEQTGLGRHQLESLEMIDSMLADITRAVENHDAATRRVREGLDQLTRQAEQHEAAVVELSGVAGRLGGRSRALADRVGKFKI